MNVLFYLYCFKMASAVQFANERSLIIIDEFGKGTATVCIIEHPTVC